MDFSEQVEKGSEHWTHTVWVSLFHEYSKSIFFYFADNFLTMKLKIRAECECQTLLPKLKTSPVRLSLLVYCCQWSKCAAENWEYFHIFFDKKSEPFSSNINKKRILDTLFQQKIHRRKDWVVPVSLVRTVECPRQA